MQTTALRLFTSHPAKHPRMSNKTYRSLVEKPVQTYMWLSSMDPYTWMYQFWPTSKGLRLLCVDIGCSLDDLLGVIDDRAKWIYIYRERESERERERERERESGKSGLSGRRDNIYFIICDRHFFMYLVKNRNTGIFYI